MMEQKFKEMGIKINASTNEDPDDTSFDALEGLNDISQQEHYHGIPFRNEL